MFCTKCGNELKDGDLFCGKCGTRVTAEPAQERVGASVDEGGKVQREEKSACDEQKKTASSPTRTRRRLPGKGLRKDLKLPPKEKFSIRPLLLSVNGSCRYCGAKLSALAERCPSCGAEGAKGTMFSPTTTLSNQSVTMADVTRAGRIGQSLGGDSPALDLATDPGCFGEGCLLMPLVIINPFFIIALVCKSHAEEALKSGKLDEAEKQKNKRNLFNFLGVLSLPLEFWLAWKLILPVILK